MTPESQFLIPADAPGQATNKLALTRPEEVTEEVVGLLRMAYEEKG